MASCSALLQALYTIRSEGQPIEQIDYNLLFRWFVGLSVDDLPRGDQLIDDEMPIERKTIADLAASR